MVDRNGLTLRGGGREGGLEQLVCACVVTNMYLVTPSCKVAECFNGEANVSLECKSVNSSRVQTL